MSRYKEWLKEKVMCVYCLAEYSRGYALYKHSPCPYKPNPHQTPSQDSNRKF